MPQLTTTSVPIEHINPVVCEGDCEFIMQPVTRNCDGEVLLALVATRTVQVYKTVQQPITRGTAEMMEWMRVQMTDLMEQAKKGNYILNSRDDGGAMSLPSWIEPRLGPQPKDDEQFQRDALEMADRIVAGTKRRFSMERVRAKFSVSNLLKDNFGNVVVKLYAVYKGDESSPENESFSNSTPSGNVELTITNPAAIVFFEKLAGKYVYLDFTEAIVS